MIGEIAYPPPGNQRLRHDGVLAQPRGAACGGVSDQGVTPRHQRAGVTAVFDRKPVGPEHRFGLREILHDIAQEHGFVMACLQRGEVLFHPLGVMQVVIVPLAHDIGFRQRHAKVAQLSKVQVLMRRVHLNVGTVERMDKMLERCGHISVPTIHDHHEF